MKLADLVLIAPAAGQISPLSASADYLELEQRLFASLTPQVG